MAKRLPQTLTDYMVIAISPALIMTMIGSLVFFLLAILNQGDHGGRVRMIFAFFILGTVMLGRLSIEEGKSYAAMYAVPLAIVTLMALGRFVQVSGPLAGFSFFVNLGIIALVWWLADKLTWDCTLIDDDVDASGAGLLEQFGLDRSEVVQRTDARSRVEGADAAPANTAVSNAATPVNIQAWWANWRRRRSQRPGMWVVYLSFAALPVFGFGQWLIPESNAALRSSSFRLLYVYLASALGLLLTTSFLGLRRYLRQRRVEMPAEMAGIWLVAGVATIIVLLGLCLMIPTRGHELPLVQLPLKLLSPDNLRTSEYAVMDEGQYSADAERSGQHSQPPDPSRQSPGDSPKTSDGQGGQQQGGQQPESDADGESGQQSSEDRGERSQETASAEKQSPPDSQGEPSDQQSQQADGQRQAESPPPRPTPPRPRPSMSPWAQSIESIFRAVFYLVLLAALICFAWKYREMLRSTLNDLLNWLRGLLGKPAEHQAADQPVEQLEARARPFSDFPDPFRSGRASCMTPAELIGYSFEACEAWARERGWPRGNQQTPHEFVQTLAAREPSLAKEAVELGAMYNRVAYAKGTLTPAHVAAAERFWKRIGNLPRQTPMATSHCRDGRHRFASF